MCISDDDEDEDEEDEEDEDEEDDEDDEDEEDDDEIIERIYGFMKKTTSGKKLNQSTLKNVAKVYWNKTRDYNKSIKLFESDIITKKFTKIYKENNN